MIEVRDRNSPAGVSQIASCSLRLETHTEMEKRTGCVSLLEMETEQKAKTQSEGLECAAGS